jgi:hypothetical protein
MTVSPLDGGKPHANQQPGYAFIRLVEPVCLLTSDFAADLRERLMGQILITADLWTAPCTDAARRSSCTDVPAGS